MISKIYWKDKLVLSSEKSGRERLFLLDDGSKINRNALESCPIKIECTECNRKNEITYYHNLDKKKYICKVCGSTGSRNAFYNKSHTDKTKNSISRHNKGNKYWVGKTHTEVSKDKMSKFWKGRQAGDKNPFYGKKHNDETKRIIVEKTRIWRENLSSDEKQNLSKIFSESQKKLQQADPAKYRKNKQKAGLASHLNHKKYKMNNLEKDVQKVLNEFGIQMKYSVIFCFKQFDFGIRDKKILLEVQGDYWHGNPQVYSEYNEIQKRNIENDKLKAQIAEKYGCKLFYIWEKDFRNKDYSVLMEIKKLLD
jgi:G:T-mismatch repair DNA endonuclease (very short patch repair protein)